MEPNLRCPDLTPTNVASRNQWTGAWCPFPYTTVLDECLYASKLELKWNDARKYCQRMSGDLASPSYMTAVQAYLRDIKCEYIVRVNEEFWLCVSLFLPSLPLCILAFSLTHRNADNPPPPLLYTYT